MPKKKDQVGIKKRNDYINIAFDLGYSNDVIERIRKAQDENTINRIMKTAREKGEYSSVYWRTI